MKKLENLKTELDKAVDEKIFSAASLMVARGKDILCHVQSGTTSFEEGAKSVDEKTIFDIASLTKPFSTATLMMLSCPAIPNLTTLCVGDFISSSHYGKVTLGQLLNHTSGLPAWRNYYQYYTRDDIARPEVDAGKNNPIVATEKSSFLRHEKIAEQNPNHEQITQTLVQIILKETPHSKPGIKCEYSDLGYILLGYILEQIYSKKLEQIFDEKIASPLALSSTFYNRLPLTEEKQLFSYAATEKCAWRGKTLLGEVHDDHAWLMGGVAGHAGLFSTTADIHRWLSELRDARNGTSHFISKEIFDLFQFLPEKRERQPRFFTLGFDTPSQPSSSGKHFSAHTLGHLGYTGTSFWWDMTTDEMIVLLTNRVHPSRENDKIKNFRPYLHDLVWSLYT